MHGEMQRPLAVMRCWYRPHPLSFGRGEGHECVQGACEDWANHAGLRCFRHVGVEWRRERRGAEHLLRQGASGCAQMIIYLFRSSVTSVLTSYSFPPPSPPISLSPLLFSPNSRLSVRILRIVRRPVTGRTPLPRACAAAWAMGRPQKRTAQWSQAIVRAAH